MKKEEGKMVVAVKNADIKTYRERSLYIGTKKGMKGALKVVKKGLEKMIEKQTAEHPILVDSEERGWHNRCITIYSTDNGIIIKPELVKNDINTTIKDVEYTLSMQIGEVLTGTMFEDTDVVSEGEEYPELSKKVEEITTTEEDDEVKLLNEGNDRIDACKRENLHDADDSESEKNFSIGDKTVTLSTVSNSIRDRSYWSVYEAQRLQEEAEDEDYAVRFVKGPFNSADIRYSEIEFTPGYYWHDTTANLPIDKSPVLLNDAELTDRIITNACEYYNSYEMTRQGLLRIIQNEYGIVPVSYIINVTESFVSSHYPLIKPDGLRLTELIQPMSDVYRTEIKKIADKYEDVIRKSLTHPGKYNKDSARWNWNLFTINEDMFDDDCSRNPECEFVVTLDWVLISIVAGSKRCVPTVVDSILKKNPMAFVRGKGGLIIGEKIMQMDGAVAKSNCKDVFDTFNIQYSAGNINADQYNVDCYGWREVYQVVSTTPIKLKDIPAGYYFVKASEYKEYINSRNGHEDMSHGASLPIYYTKYNGKMIGGGYRSPYHIYSPNRTMLDCYEGDASLLGSSPVKRTINELLSSNDKNLREIGKDALNDLKNTECYLIAQTAFVMDAGGDDNE